MAKSIMIQGTMSNAGKSIVAAGLCRVFHQDGFRTAPFKSQNMALNSFITEEGLEMGRAQVMQAEAAGIRPLAAMNPILLKPTSDTGSQVIVNGEVRGVMSAAAYFRKKKELIPVILDAYRKLEEAYEIIVIEGAGSPAEINLKQEDIVNMGLAELVDAPVLLVGDIDRGGVFAQIVGTIELLEEKERARIMGTIINKFRGDKAILEPGLRMLEERTRKRVMGVIPYVSLDLDDEDSLTERFERKPVQAAVDLAVIRYPRISNFTDLAALECMEEAGVRYVDRPEKFGTPDAVILPGTKNTIKDLLWMRQNGLEAKVLRAAAEGKLVFGICGGYQMLGKEIRDPDGIEQKGVIAGMGLLPVCTTFCPEKTRTRVKGTFGEVPGMLESLQGVEIEGYEIHMGLSRRIEEGKSLLILQDTLREKEETDFLNELWSVREPRKREGKPDGAVSETGNVYGCYVHGIFDRPEAAKGIVSVLMRRKGLDSSQIHAIDPAEYKRQQYDKLADVIRENLDMEAIYQKIGICLQKRN